MPVAMPRGLPVDFNPTELVQPKGSREWPIEVFLGDRSHSWLLADEILSAIPSRALEANLSAEISEFQDLVRHLADLHGEVRFVYAFA